jgi:lipopolysaccharide biosynthesis regulator YciM
MNWLRLYALCTPIFILLVAYFWSEYQEELIAQKQPIRQKKMALKKNGPAQKSSTQLVVTGDIFCNQGDLARAVVWYKKAVKKSRRSPQACLHLGLALAMQGNMNQAVETLANLRNTSPRYFRSFCSLGFLMYHTTLFRSHQRTMVNNKAALKEIIAKYLAQT